MAKFKEYEKSRKNPRIGQKINGWKCIEHYDHFNLWQRVSNTGTNGIKTCFPLNCVPTKESLNYESN